MNPPLTRRAYVLRLCLIIGFLIIVAYCVYVIVSAIANSHSTGTLHVSASNPKAALSISQPDHQAQSIGVGEATVQLSPGSYKVSASYGPNLTSSTVQITKKHITNLSLKLVSKPPLPSVADIDFTNIDTLIDSGITTTQVNVLEQDFFQFKQNTQKVSIIPGSVSPAPRDPNTSTSFTLNFSVQIDSAEYKASATYADLDNIRLMLYDTAGQLVFDSYTNVQPVE